MSKETEHIITIALLGFAAMAWLWPLLAAMQMENEERKKRKEPPQYDERQRIARLRAGNHALYALLGFLVVWTAADRLGEFPWTGSVLDMTLCGMILAWGVRAAECIWHDAFVTWKDKRKDADALALVWCGGMFTWTYPAGALCETWLPFIFSAAYAAVLLVIIIRKHRRRKKVEVEDGI